MDDLFRASRLGTFRMCADCALMGEDDATPHGLLVGFGASVAGKMRYRCLVCNTHHLLDACPEPRVQL